MTFPDSFCLEANPLYYDYVHCIHLINGKIKLFDGGCQHMDIEEEGIYTIKMEDENNGILKFRVDGYDEVEVKFKREIGIFRLEDEDYYSIYKEKFIFEEDPLNIGLWKHKYSVKELSLRTYYSNEISEEEEEEMKLNS